MNVVDGCQDLGDMLQSSIDLLESGHYPPHKIPESQSLFVAAEDGHNE